MWSEPFINVYIHFEETNNKCIALEWFLCSFFSCLWATDYFLLTIPEASEVKLTSSWILSQDSQVYCQISITFQINMIRVDPLVRSQSFVNSQYHF